MESKLRLFILVTALICSLAAGLAPAPAHSEGLEELIVTGSRIGRDPAEYVGPMSVIDSADIERTPNYSVQDMLLKLPSIGLQGISRNNASGGRGAHLSGIHQLTPARTLVLLNNRRMVHTISSSLAIGVDLQSFPVNLIDSIEVLADGGLRHLRLGRGCRRHQRQDQAFLRVSTERRFRDAGRPGRRLLQRGVHCRPHRGAGPYHPGCDHRGYRQRRRPAA